MIPETYDMTTFSGKSAGDPVNGEFDVLAKYVKALC